MEKLIVETSFNLKGKVKPCGAKNAALPIMAASLLSNGECIINDVPPLTDIFVMKEILESLGATVIWNPVKSSMTIKSKNIRNNPIPSELMRKIRASVLVMGPLLSRFGRCSISLPGGCGIGLRPIDLHIKGFSAMGCQIDLEHGNINAHTKVLTGERIYLDFPSVGATENIIMAACLAKGTTTIENAATEPEIVDLANFLSSMGASIRGAGTDTIKINGTDELHGTNYTIIPDRIEAGTFMAATAACGGNIIIEDITSEHLKPVIAKLREMNMYIEDTNSGLRVISEGFSSLSPIEVKTMPHPGFPTDLQSQITSVLALVKGTSVVTETVFENRFLQVPELIKMGANIRIVSRTAFIEGVNNLSSAKLIATDLRAGAALVVAALCADGISEIEEAHHIDRGYYKLEDKLFSLGAKIKRSTEEEYNNAII